MSRIREWLKARVFSFPTRILGVFIVQALVTMVLLAMVGAYVVKHNNHERLPLLIEDYLQRLVVDLPEQPEMSVFIELHQQTGLHFAYQQSGQWVFTTKNQHVEQWITHLDQNEREDWHHFSKHPDWRWDFERGHLLISMPYYQGTLWVFSGFKEARDANIGFWLAVFVISLMLLLTYLWVRRLVAPIKEIEKGVRHYADGEFAYRLSVEGGNDLAVLSETINQMANDIEDRLQKNRDLFLAMSHELRTPLTRLRLATEMLENSSNKSLMQRSQREMEELIDVLLLRERLLYQPSDTTQPPETERVTAAQLMAWTKQETVGFDSEVVTDIPNDFAVCVDVFALRILLKNLLSNASKYGRGEKIVFQVTDLKTSWALSVEDFGIGLTEAEMGRIFEPFYRVDKARLRETGGHGLGLYLVQGLAKQLGTKVHVESKKELGSRFYFELPKSSTK